MVELKHADINKVLNTRKRVKNIKNVCPSEGWPPQIKSIDWITPQTINKLSNSLNTKAQYGLDLLKSSDKKTREEVRHQRRVIEEIFVTTCVLKGFTEWHPKSKLSKYLLEIAETREFQFHRAGVTTLIPNLEEFKRLVNKKPVCFFKAIGRFYKNQWKEEGTLYTGKNEKRDLQLNAEKTLNEAVRKSSSPMRFKVDISDKNNFTLTAVNGLEYTMSRECLHKLWGVPYTVPEEAFDSILSNKK
jgi:hypothetical protein